MPVDFDVHSLAEDIDKSRGQMTHLFGAFWIPGDPIVIHGLSLEMRKECTDIWQNL